MDNDALAGRLPGVLSEGMNVPGKTEKGLYESYVATKVIEDVPDKTIKGPSFAHDVALAGGLPGEQLCTMGVLGKTLKGRSANYVDTVVKEGVPGKTIKGLTVLSSTAMRDDLSESGTAEPCDVPDTTVKGPVQAGHLPGPIQVRMSLFGHCQ